jgi:hypothetical protein
MARSVSFFISLFIVIASALVSFSEAQGIIISNEPPSFAPTPSPTSIAQLRDFQIGISVGVIIFFFILVGLISLCSCGSSNAKGCCCCGDVENGVVETVHR